MSSYTKSAAVVAVVLAAIFSASSLASGMELKAKVATIHAERIAQIDAAINGYAR